MKVGLIFECGPQGADKKVCEHLIKTFFPGVQIVPSVTMSNKQLLVMNCGKVARALLEDGCDLVLIIWDEQPRWAEIEEKTFCHNDVAKIRGSLRGEIVDDERTRLVCIKQELEAWLAADERALSSFLSSPTHPFRCPKCRKPDEKQNGKKHLYQVFQDAKRPKYIDLDHALPITQRIVDLTRLRKLQSFARFEKLLLGTAPACTRHYP